MAEYRAAGAFENYRHSETCRCSFDNEVRRRKEAAVPPTKEALAAAQAILDERRKFDAQQAAREAEVLQSAGHLEDYLKNTYSPKPPATEDLEAKRLRDKERVEKEFLSRGRK